MLIKEKNAFRIVHLSDIHCDSSGEWSTIFGQVEDVINEVSPNLIIITGDCVNRPRKKHFDYLKARLIALLNKLNHFISDEQAPVYLLTVPGNHDYFPLFGNKLYHPSKTCYETFVSDLHKEIGAYHTKLGVTCEETIKNIFIYHGISFFLFDSNETLPFRLARGNVKDPRQKVEDMSTFWEGIKTGVKSFEKSFKIGLLHHHPISPGKYIPDNLLKMFQNVAIDMENSYPFLKAVNKGNLNLILHGHKHKGGEISIAFPSFKEASDELPFAISACGSSSKCSEHKLEIKIYDICNLTSCDTYSFIYDQDERPQFVLNKSNSKVLIRESNRRKQLNKYSSDLIPNEKVKRAKLKSKQVQIYKSGNADAEIMIYGIQARKDHSVQFDELISIDYGRIIWGKSISSSKEYALDDDRNWDDWNTPYKNAVNFNDTASQPEVFIKSFSVPKKTLEYTDNLFRVRYHYQNGYVFTQDEHKMLYSNSNLLNLGLKEYCSIVSEFPVDEMELIVRFPEENNCFPGAGSFSIMVQEYLSGKVQKVESEIAYLEKVEALRVRSFYNSVVLQIKNPQPNLIYSIVWNTLESKLHKAYEPEKDSIAFLQNLFLKGDQVVKDFVAELQCVLREIYDDNDLYVFPAGYSSETKKIGISVNPDSSKFSQFNDVAPGRGLVGSAFLRREGNYWDNEPIKNEFGNNPYKIEKMVEGLEPKVVIGLPLSLSSYFYGVLAESEVLEDVEGFEELKLTEDVDEFEELENYGDSPMYREHGIPFASLSIVSEKNTSALKIDYVDKPENYKASSACKDAIEEKIFEVLYYVEALVPKYFENQINKA